MGAIADLSDLIHRATGGAGGNPQTLMFHKTPRIGSTTGTTPIAGRPATLWRYSGISSGSGAIPPSGPAVCTRDTNGAISGWDNPAIGKELYLTQAFCTGINSGTLLLYDRLLQCGGLSGSVGGAKTVQGATPTVPLTRYTDGRDNFAFAEIHTQIGVTTSAILMTYKNRFGVTRTGPSVLFGNTNYREATRAIMLPLAESDYGITSVESVTYATTGTAGNISIVIGQPIAYLGISAAGTPTFRDFVSGLPGIPKIQPDACLSLLWIPTIAGLHEITGGLSFVEA